MSGIVLRCPNCGTAQPADGECEACREAQVRYFCTNHSPGLWLDSASCGQCGARFGDPVPAREAPRAPPEPAEYRRPQRSEPGLDLPGIDPALGPWAAGPPEEPAPGRDGRRGPDVSGLLLAILNAAARGRRPGAERYDDAEFTPPRRGGGGCLGRLLMLVLLLVALFLMVPIFLGALLGFG